MKVIAVIGSNRGRKSTSASLVRYMEHQLAPQGIPFSFHFARSIYGSDEKWEAFVRELKQSTEKDLLVICAPDYVDSLPGPLVQLFEKLRDTSGPQGMAGRKVMALIHSGYPEPQQRRPGLEMCRLFSAEMGMKWCGGLSFGGTSPINGQPLQAAGPFAKKILPVLDLTVEKIAGHQLAETEDLILEDLSAMPVPSWMIKILMNTMTRIKAFKDKQDLLVKPFRNKE